MCVDVVMQICRDAVPSIVLFFSLETLTRTEVDNILHVNKEYEKMNRRIEE